MVATAGSARSGVEMVGRRPGRRKRSGYASSPLSAKSRDRDLVEEIMKAQQEFAELRKEPRSVGAELQPTKILVQKHEEALAASRRSLAEAAAAAAAIRAPLGPVFRLKG
eukprot:g15428.t1